MRLDLHEEVESQSVVHFCFLNLMIEAEVRKMVGLLDFDVELLRCQRISWVHLVALDEVEGKPGMP